MSREEDEQNLVHMVDAWASAELRGDADFLGRILTDDFIGIGPLGFMLTKQEWLARHRSGDLKYSSFGVDEMSVRMYAGAAIVLARQLQQATYRGASIPGRFRVGLILVTQEGQWRLAGLQLSAIGEPPIPSRS